MSFRDYENLFSSYRCQYYNGMYTEIHKVEDAVNIDIYKFNAFVFGHMNLLYAYSKGVSSLKEKLNEKEYNNYIKITKFCKNEFDAVTVTEAFNLLCISYDYNNYPDNILIKNQLMFYVENMIKIINYTYKNLLRIYDTLKRYKLEFLIIKAKFSKIPITDKIFCDIDCEYKNDEVIEFLNKNNIKTKYNIENYIKYNKLRYFNKKIPSLFL